MDNIGETTVAASGSPAAREVEASAVDASATTVVSIPLVPLLPMRKQARCRASADETMPFLQRLALWIGSLAFVGCLLALIYTVRIPVPLPSPGGAATTTVVVIDAGHGGWDSGAVALGMVEKTLTLDVAQRVAAVLHARNIPISLTRTSDHYVPLAERVQMANALPRAIFVSIHFNDAATLASGIETYYTDKKEETAPLGRPWKWVSWITGDAAQRAPAPPPAEGRALATAIQTALVRGTSMLDRGVKEESLYVTHRVRWPAVLVEGGFLNDPREAHLLGDAAYRQRLAESIADGIVRYLANARPGTATAGSGARIE